MEWSNFSDKKIALLGAGKENLSLIPHLTKVGANLIVREKSTLGVRLPANIGLEQGEGYLDDLDKFDIVFRSPGLPVRVLDDHIKELSKKPVVTSAVNLLLEMKGTQVVGVTGTKGKGTTSSMITEILCSADRHVILAGNIGNSIFDDWENIKDETIIVMELSSFQLEDVRSSPATAVLLSVTPEHLKPLSKISPNYHANLPEYVKAKGHITMFQKPSDLLVYSADSQASKQIGTSSSAKKVSVSSHIEADSRLTGGSIEYMNLQIDLAKLTKLRGDHTLFNAAVAATVCSNLGIDKESIVKGLSSFKTLPHRMEMVGVYGGVEFVDDSFATSPEAAIAALSAFKDRGVIIILGGSSKGADFGELAKVISKQNVKAAILIGEESDKLDRALKEFSLNTPRFKGFSTYRDAVETTIHRAKPGEVVLLSPACASKDMFTNATERGEEFVRIVHELV